MGYENLENCEIFTCLKFGFWKKFYVEFLYSSVEMKINFNGIQVLVLVETIIIDLASL